MTMEYGLLTTTIMANVIKHKHDRNNNDNNNNGDGDDDDGNDNDNNNKLFDNNQQVNNNHGLIDKISKYNQAIKFT